MNIHVVILNNINKLRIRQDYSYKELASLVGITESNYNVIKNRKRISLDVANRFARTLGVTLADLVKVSDDEFDVKDVLINLKKDIEKNIETKIEVYEKIKKGKATNNQ